VAGVRAEKIKAKKYVHMSQSRGQAPFFYVGSKRTDFRQNRRTASAQAGLTSNQPNHQEPSARIHPLGDGQDNLATDYVLQTLTFYTG
jgi:hypothetical protein